MQHFWIFWKLLEKAFSRRKTGKWPEKRRTGKRANEIECPEKGKGKAPNLKSRARHPLIHSLTGRRGPGRKCRSAALLSFGTSVFGCIGVNFCNEIYNFAAFFEIYTICTILHCYNVNIQHNFGETWSTVSSLPARGAWLDLRPRHYCIWTRSALFFRRFFSLFLRVKPIF